MAVRSSMADLIARVRSLIGDPSVDTQQLSDQEVQDKTDQTHKFVQPFMLRQVASYPSGGIVVVVVNDFFANLGNWESDAKLQAPSSATPMPATTGHSAGRWTFTTSARRHLARRSALICGMVYATMPL